MKIDEAIKRLENIQMEFLPLPRHTDWKAAQLGIEALKRVKEERTGYERYAPDLLPGETPEEEEE